jgi:hypothetical protein
MTARLSGPHVERHCLIALPGSEPFVPHSHPAVTKLPARLLPAASPRGLDRPFGMSMLRDLSGLLSAVVARPCGRLDLGSATGGNVMSDGAAGTLTLDLKGYIVAETNGVTTVPKTQVVSTIEEARQAQLTRLEQVVEYLKVLYR